MTLQHFGTEAPLLCCQEVGYKVWTIIYHNLDNEALYEYHVVYILLHLIAVEELGQLITTSALLCHSFGREALQQGVDAGGAANA